MGSGINSFSYTQYVDQSAFYDVRFIHNSVLQIAYDIGIIASVVFLLIVVLGAIIILKSNTTNKIYIFMIYTTIFMHSLLDFDLSFASIFILFCALVTFSSLGQPQVKVNKIKLSKHKFIYFFIAAIGIYALAADMLILSGNIFSSNASFNNALSIYKLADKLELHSNPYTCINIAEVYNKKHVNNQDLKNSILFLKKAYKLNPLDPIITGNIAFEYERLNEILKADSYYIKFLKKERFYYKAYISYNNFLKKHYSKNNINYKHGMGVMKKVYMNAINNLNLRSSYMNDQLYILQNPKLNLHLQ